MFIDNQNYSHVLFQVKSKDFTVIYLLYIFLIGSEDLWMDQCNAPKLLCCTKYDRHRDLLFLLQNFSNENLKKQMLNNIKCQTPPMIFNALKIYFIAVVASLLWKLENYFASSESMSPIRSCLFDFWGLSILVPYNISWVWCDCEKLHISNVIMVIVVRYSYPGPFSQHYS